MKPLIFDYAKDQRKEPTPALSYDRDSGLNYIDDIKFVELCNTKSILQTKTFTQREADDEEKVESSFISPIHLATKTDTISEVDDDMNLNGNFVYLLTKTEQDKEQDE
ncbi:hypothetical protein [Leptospira santarosai]|uniref:hypothetical protein n=1 Tax=Leptospira santarosai TaxID=28183 RepID=UPI0024AEBF89|nr:hypothetical protein [Leptospira santarosai]MDI7225252.1 hypothetical protein [Leptospira santarosai]